MLVSESILQLDVSYTSEQLVISNGESQSENKLISIEEPDWIGSSLGGSTEG